MARRVRCPISGFPLWGVRDLFYSNNPGIARIKVERISPEPEGG